MVRPALPEMPVMFGFRLAFRRGILLGVAVATLGALTQRRSPAAVPVPGRQPVESVDFERHVMGLFGRAGCNSGSCHGSFQGKGGFRLSLFGYDPAKDFLALTRDQFGRRINPVDPDSSPAAAQGDRPASARGRGAASARIPGSIACSATGSCRHAVAAGQRRRQRIDAQRRRNT